MESGKGVAILSRSELLCVLVTRRAAFSFLRFIALYLHLGRMAAACGRPSVALSQECFARAAEWIEYWQCRAFLLHRSGTAPGGVVGFDCVSWLHLLSISLVTARKR